MEDAIKKDAPISVQKQIDLEELLCALSNLELPEGKSYHDYGAELIRIYSDDFRHQYGSITGKLMTLEKDEKKLVVRLNLLGDNLRSVCEEMERLPEEGFNGNRDEILRGVKKLLDHISLEQIRVDYLWQSYGQQSISLSNSFKESNQKLDEAKKLAEKNAEESRSLKTEVISILSIFAALVLMVNGGFQLLGSAFTALGNQSGYLPVSIVAVVVGIVMFNAIYALLYVASRLTGKHIGSPDHQNCNRCTSGKPCEEIVILDNGIKKTKIRHLKRAFYKQPFWVTVNLLLLVVLLLLLAFGAVISQRIFGQF